MALDPSMLRDALARTRRPITAEEAIEEFGGGARGRSRLAMRLAGTDDKKSKAYKSAMRSLQRYAAAEGRERRRMGGKLGPRIGQAAQIERAAKRLRGPLTVRWIAPTVRVSSDIRQRLDLEAELDDEALEEIRELLEAGEEQDAIDALAAISLEAYMGRANGEILDASRLRFEPV